LLASLLLFAALHLLEPSIGCCLYYYCYFWCCLVTFLISLLLLLLPAMAGVGVPDLLLCPHYLCCPLWCSC
jgi:hypothetical protein